MKSSNTLLLICSVLLLSGCVFDNRRIKGNGNMVTENRSAKNFDKLKVTGEVNVKLSEGAPSLKIEADENLVEYITTGVEDGWLIVGTRDDINIRSKNKLTVYISTPGIYKISISGSSDVNAETKFSSDKEVSVNISGSGNLKIPLHCPSVDVSIAGSGDCELSGETRDVSVSIAGSGNFNGKYLKAENARISIAGSGNATVFADVNLDAKIMGSGDVYYKGNANVKTNIMGSGSVKKSN